MLNANRDLTRDVNLCSPERISVSLIVATIGRTAELDRMLASMAEQNRADFELIIVDQNSDDSIDSYIQKWKRVLNITRIHSDPGASRSRNMGIGIARGDIIGFPDDDCWYPAGLLEGVATWFDQNIHYDFLCCGIRDENHHEVASRWPKRSAELDYFSILRACACSSLFIRKSVLIASGRFDETLGPGPDTIVKSAEEIDLVCRLIKKSHRGWFEKSLHVHHPCKEVGHVPSRRAFVYGVGFGFLLHRHRYPIYILAYNIIRPLAGALLSIARLSLKETLFYWGSASGRLIGYLRYSQASLRFRTRPNA